MVRAKFKVCSIRRSDGQQISGKKNEIGYDIYEPCEIQTIELTPVYGKGDPNHENTKFWNATPTGKIELGCINLDAGKYFKLGTEYYVDFKEVITPCYGRDSDGDGNCDKHK